MIELLKRDIDIAIVTWKNLLIKYSQHEIEYIYVKGSSVKTWDSNIDYVPQLSDIDIHIKVKDDKTSSLMNPTVEQSLLFSREFEENFKNTCINLKHQFIHIPRIQIVIINKISKKLEQFTFSREEDVLLILGKIENNIQDEFEIIRKKDKTQLLILPETLNKISSNLLDRSDPFELYILLRRICFIVSPTPVRLLTQLLTKTNPYDIWTWNKTRIVKELEMISLSSIAHHYKQYYESGWDLFKTGFSDTDKFRKIILLAYTILKEVYEIFLKIQEKDKSIPLEYER